MGRAPDRPPGARLEVEDGRRIVTLTSPAGRAVVHEHGAHVTAWDPGDGRGDVLFTSAAARFDGRSAIRGGVPVIFPQFGPGPLPKHGFARTRAWVLDEAGPGTGDPHAASARFSLADDAATRETWPHRFAATLTVTLDDALTIALAVTNTDDAPFTFTAALHGYLRVADVAQVRVLGLEHMRFRDQLTRIETTEAGMPVVILGATDRVYVDVPRTLHVVDGVTGRMVRMDTSGFPDAVLWNPSVEGAAAIDDLLADEWKVMLCLEPATVATPVTLAPGARWEGVQRLSIES